MELKTKDKANGKRNSRINYIQYLNWSLQGEPTDRVLLGQGTQSLHQTCLNTRTYPVNNALAEKRALALDDWARGCKEWDEATKCFGETKDCPLTSSTLVPE